MQEDWPTTLREFVRQAVELGEVRFRPLGPSVLMGLPGLLSRGMTPQKQREVPGLAALVADVCRQARCTSVLDVGSGLVRGIGTVARAVGFLAFVRLSRIRTAEASHPDARERQGVRPCSKVSTWFIV